jgi:Heterokaryon incompatibility protein (HET)
MTSVLDHLTSSYLYPSQYYHWGDQMARKSIYRHLQRDCHEIRVLQPERSSSTSDGLLKYKLKYILLDNDLASASSLARGQSDKAPQRKRRKTTSGMDSRYATPSYIALSYTWGDAEDTTPIQVAGREKMVTRNLRDALFTLSTEPRTASLPVWADAVCINQEDITERNREVKRMAVIYECAASVIIWLGCVPTTWNFRGLRPTENINNILPRVLVYQETEAMDNRQQYDYTSDEILTIVAIFDRPYWRRIWILQELVSARFEDTFFFWAGGLRHISVLQEINNTFSGAVNAWLESEHIASFLRGVSTSEKRVTDEIPNTLSPRRNLKDDMWQAALIRSSANQARKNMGQTNHISDIADRIVQKTITGQEIELSDYMRKYSSSDIAQRIMEASFTGEKLDIKDYQQKHFHRNNDIHSSTIQQELDNMASGMKDEIRKLEEFLKAITAVNSDGDWSIRLTELKLAVSDLSITAMDTISAASLDKSKEKVDFGHLMRHALYGKCTNKVDLVYGLLGLHLEEIVSQITVDYQLTYERVFSDFSAAVIRSRGLNFLCEYGFKRPRISSNLPSWVIDLSEATIMEGQVSQKWRKFNAGGMRPGQVQFSADNSQLLCSALLYRVDLKTPRAKYFSKDLIRQALERIVSCHHPDEESCRSILNISPESTSNDPKITASLELCRLFRAVHSEFAIEGLQLDDLFPVLEDIVEWDIEVASQALNNMRFQTLFTTIDGKLGLGSDNVRDGDYIAVVQGFNIPMVLREREAGYDLIGMCYVDGLMLREDLGANPNWKQITIL